MRTWLLDRSWTLLLTAILVGSIIYNVDGSDNYLTVDNLVNLFELSIEKIIVVVAMTFVIIAGEIDLSVASVMVLAASIVAWLQDSGDVPFAVAVLVALIASAAVGYTQGWLITRLGLPSLVVTLAGLITWRGVGAHPRRGSLLRRLPRVVRPPRPGRAPGTAAVLDRVLRRPPGHGGLRPPSQ